MESKSKARKGLAIFFVVFIAGSAYIERKVYLLGGSVGNHLGWIYLLMWWVTISSVVARVILRESPRDVSFRWGGWAGTRAVLIATALPLVAGSLAYGIAWNTGLAHFTGPTTPDSVLGIPMSGNPVARFFTFLLIMLTVGGIRSCRSAAGEEIGWRGYMLTRLIDGGIPAPIFVSGLVWALWHTPLILSGQYASGPHPLASAGLFVCDVVAMGYIFAWLRLSSGSIWPCIWAHGVWNAVIQGPFDMSTGGDSIWIGESGILTVIFVVGFAVVLFRVWPLEKVAQPAIWSSKAS